MPKKDRRKSPMRAAKAEPVIRIAKLEKEPQRILRRAAKAPVTIAVKRQGNELRIATIRPGEKSDPVFKPSLPVSVEALKRRGKRIVALASHLQIALSVRANKKSALVYFIEPGTDSIEYAAERLGCTADEAGLVKNALRHSAIARTAVDAAARQADSRHGGELETMRGRIATLERAVKEARAGRTATEAAAEKIGAEPLKRRIATLERSLKQQVALGESYKKRLAEQTPPDPEAIPAGTA